MAGFSSRARKIIEKFKFDEEIEQLEDANRLFEVVKEIAAVDLHPDTISNIDMGYLFEDLVRRFNEQANEEAGDHFTPREVIGLMVNLLFTHDDLVYQDSKVIKIYDPTCGTGGMLSESEKIIADPETGLNPGAHLKLFGQEYNSESFAICGSDLMIKGEDASNIVFGNTLGTGKPKDGFVDGDGHPQERFHYMLANPPFGGKERPEVQQNFPIRTGETAFLFLQHFIKILRAGGRGGIVIKNTFLSNTDNASVSLRQKLLEECNLHTVLDCPGGTFIGAGVKTVVLFFEKGTRTRKVWFYQLDPGRNMGKTNPLNDADLAEFIELQKTRADSPKSWSVDVAAIDPKTFDLSVKNPNGGEEIAHRSPQEIMDEIAALDAESAEVLGNLKALL